MRNIYLLQKRMLLCSYAVIIVYLMFFGFGRIVRYPTYRISYVFHSFPLWFPRHLNPREISLWIFSIGNVVAFVPFGILIPDCFPDILGKYFKSLLVFIACITGLEILQCYTRLGIYDVEDIVINAVGYSIGYCSWRIAFQIDDKVKKALVCVMLVFLFTLISIITSELLNAAFFADPRAAVLL